MKARPITVSGQGPETQHGQRSALTRPPRSKRLLLPQRPDRHIPQRVQQRVWATCNPASSSMTNFCATRPGSDGMTHQQFSMRRWHLRPRFGNWTWRSPTTAPTTWRTIGAASSRNTDLRHASCNQAFASVTIPTPGSDIRHLPGHFDHRTPAVVGTLATGGDDRNGSVPSTVVGEASFNT